MSPVTENIYSTGTEPADCCNHGPSRNILLQHQSTPFCKTW